ncbi:hypothetical protein BV20DRAFT_628003 [Pilatotrama ljubarskyi]|nr:hypothetical protein BV20DRAFT_628003 [Pilatotrama ljubarskyi]
MLLGVEDEPEEPERAPSPSALLPELLEVEPVPLVIPAAAPTMSRAAIPQFDHAQTFVDALRANPRLEDSDLDVDIIHQLRNPITRCPTLTPDERLSVRLYLADSQGADQIYTDTRKAILERHPEDEVLSLHLVKKKVADLTGVCSLTHDMCPKSCMAYTGPWATLDKCNFCEESRYEGVIEQRRTIRKPRRQFDTYALGPQIQARYRSSDGAQDMRYRQSQMSKILEELRQSGELDHIGDIIDGSDFWDACQRGQISEDDTCVLFSMDGAQLYEHKASNCWIYIWILVDVAPGKRYKKRYILPGAIIPGPTKPKHFESFLFPGFHHVAALQKEGFSIWDAYRDIVFVSRPWVFAAGADAIGAPDVTGLVSHHGKLGCRHWCGRPGRRKPGGSHYYSVCLKPEGYCEQGCEDDDHDPSVVGEALPELYQEKLSYVRNATSMTNYEARRLGTGISKPSLFSGLSPSHTLPIPRLFPGDIMHLFGLNIPDLFYRLWHGTFDCDVKNGDSRALWDWVCLTGEVWAQHGESIATARCFLPESFHRPPRNPAEKISSGYKCWEFLNWFYGLAPAFLYGRLPEKYWQHYCKLVAGVRIVFQRESSGTQRERAHILLSDFAYDYEVLYVQRKISRMHFVPQCMHGITHTATETCRIGSLICTCQFAMERIIGDLGAEIRQPSNPYANLSQRALRRARVNALKTMLPDLESSAASAQVPIIDLGNDYTLLHPREPGARPVSDEEDLVIFRFIEALVGMAEARQTWVITMESCVQRWARVRLPNGQVCRSAWKEVPNKVSRISRNVKYRPSSSSMNLLLGVPESAEVFEYAEVQYYFRCKISGTVHTLALVSRYGPPNNTLLGLSSGVVWACRASDSGRQLSVINVRSIVACVAMVPCDTLPCPAVGHWDGKVYFAMDKLGVDIDEILGTDVTAVDMIEDMLPSTS